MAHVLFSSICTLHFPEVETLEVLELETRKDSSFITFGEQLTDRPRGEITSHLYSCQVVLYTHVYISFCSNLGGSGDAGATALAFNFSSHTKYLAMLALAQRPWGLPSIIWDHRL